jgi:Nucleotidyl transferase AbiEii toxin, Type IV TA system
MSLESIVESLSRFFARGKMDFGIIGAFAMYSYGYIRATRDIDFITRAEYKTKVIKYLESLGFETIHSSDAFSNHLHPIGSVRIDIMYVDPSTADAIFKETQRRLVLKDLELPVVSAEHLIAMKLFAVQSNPERRFKDFADIREILKHATCDMRKVREYFRKYGQESYYKEITGESANA